MMNIRVDKILLELVDGRETCYQVKIKKQQATRSLYFDVGFYCRTCLWTFF